ncbi:EAL domain-containing protein, partial [Desulfogranum marinum]|uniref:EAL domain-containing protein n=1 Tax=Desulfogranum marinum TaxID=453220 RepID=UPI00196615CC
LRHGLQQTKRPVKKPCSADLKLSIMEKQQVTRPHGRELRKSGYLELELTERVMMEIAIDDFGTGYSALSHLQIFPLTTLKIDKSFVQNIDKEGSNSSLLPSIVAIAKSFNLNVVAEGVETEKQCAALRTMECDELQGFFFSKPLPHNEIEAMLNTPGGC